MLTKEGQNCSVLFLFFSENIKSTSKQRRNITRKQKQYPGIYLRSHNPSEKAKCLNKGENFTATPTKTKTILGKTLGLT